MKIKWICKHCGNPNICERTADLICDACDERRTDEELVRVKELWEIEKEEEARREAEEKRRKEEEARRKAEEERRRKEEEARRKAEEERRRKEREAEEHRKREDERRKREEEERRRKEEEARRKAEKGGSPLRVILLAAVILFVLWRGCPVLSGMISDRTSGTRAETTEEVTEIATEEETVDIREEFIFYDSDSRYLTEDEVSALSKEEIQIAINEIYARRGRSFTTPELNEYFSSKSWYEPQFSESEFSTSVFNEFENANINLLAKYRKKKG